MKFMSKIRKKSAYDEKYLWPIFSLFIRFRDTDEKGYGKCFTCNAIKHWSEADAGHGISRAHKSVKYSEINVNLQDKRCNGFEAGARDVYAAEIDKKYGEGTWYKLTIASKVPFKYTQYEFDVMTDAYCEQVIEMAKKKGIDPMELRPVKAWVNKRKNEGLKGAFVACLSMEPSDTNITVKDIKKLIRSIE